MKKIKINESQYRMLMESGAIIGDDNKKEFNDTNEIGVTATIHDETGELKRGKPVPTDRIAKSITPQSWANGVRKGGVAG